jgi:hypothetical protein
MTKTASKHVGLPAVRDDFELGRIVARMPIGRHEPVTQLSKRVTGIAARNTPNSALVSGFPPALPPTRRRRMEAVERLESSQYLSPSPSDHARLDPAAAIVTVNR